MRPGGANATAQRATGNCSHHGPTSSAAAIVLRARCTHADAFVEALALRGEPLAGHTAQLLRLLDRYGAAELDAALTDALARGAISAASVAHGLDQRTRARHAPPPLAVVLPDDPRVRDLRVTPHALTAYDALCTPPAATKESDDDTD